jgi:Family of unknown function (DUF6216)
MARGAVIGESSGVRNYHRCNSAWERRMNIDSVVTLSEQASRIVSNIGAIFGGLVGVLVIYVLVRTGSARALRLRIWRIVLGDLPISNEAVRTSVEASVSLDQIRYHLGLPLSSLPQAQRVCHWLDTHEVEPNLLRSAGKLFNLNDFKLHSNRPSVKLAGQMVLGLILAYFASMLSLGLLASHGTYYTVRATGTTFAADETSVRTVGFSSTKLTVDQCRSPLQAASATLDAEAREVMCEFLLNPKLKDELAKGKRSQKALLLTLGFLLAIPIAFAIRHGARAFDIQALADKLGAISAREAGMALPAPADQPALPA